MFSVTIFFNSKKFVMFFFCCENFTYTYKRTISVTLLPKQSILTNLDYSEARFLKLGRTSSRDFIAGRNDPGAGKKM